MEGHELSYFLVAAEIAEKIAKIDPGRRGKLKILVQKTGVLKHYQSQMTSFHRRKA